MPILDTEVIFAFNPKDKHHKHALDLLREIKSGKLRNIVIPDTAILEFITVLKAKGVTIEGILLLLNALKTIMKEYSIKETKTLGIETLTLALHFMKKGASFFDALLAASAKIIDNTIISDDTIYDHLGVQRIPFGEERKTNA